MIPVLIASPHPNIDISDVGLHIISQSLNAFCISNITRLALEKDKSEYQSTSTCSHQRIVTNDVYIYTQDWSPHPNALLPELAPKPLHYILHPLLCRKKKLFRTTTQSPQNAVLNHLNDLRCKQSRCPRFTLQASYIPDREQTTTLSPFRRNSSVRARPIPTNLTLLSHSFP